jgi:hypothetical protein
LRVAADRSTSICGEGSLGVPALTITAPATPPTPNMLSALMMMAGRFVIPTILAAGERF